MSKRLILDIDPLFGITQYIRPDDEGVTIETVYEDRPVLDANQRCRGVHTEAPRGDQTWGNHVASIPVWQWEMFCRENPELRLQTEDAMAWLVAKLNSRDFAHLKTFDGRA